MAKILTNNEKETTTKKTNNIIIASLSILLCVSLCVGGFYTYKYFTYKDSLENKLEIERVYDETIDSYNKEANRYSKIINDNSIENIYNYLKPSIEVGEYYPTIVMDKFFSELFPKATQAEKINLFYLYYQNIQTAEQTYYDYLNLDNTLSYFNNYWNGYDFNTLEGIDNCKQKELQYYMMIMKANGFSIDSNYPEMRVLFDWDSFLEKYSDILDDEYIKFVNLQNEGQKMIINPNGKGYNSLIPIWYIHQYEEFIKSTNNYYLKSAGQTIYEQYLNFFLGLYDSDFVLEDDTIAEQVLVSYQYYIDLYKDDETTTLLRKLVKFASNEEVTGDEIIEYFKSSKEAFINDSTWLVDNADVNNDYKNTTETEDVVY